MKKTIPARGRIGIYRHLFPRRRRLLLQQKRADAAIEDSSLLDDLATKSDNLVTLPGLDSNDPIGIAVAKGDPEFVRWLDMFVSDHIQSGARRGERTSKWWGEKSIRRRLRLFGKMERAGGACPCHLSGTRFWQRNRSGPGTDMSSP